VKTRIVLSGVAVAGADVPTLGRFRPRVGAFERIVASISGPDEAIRLASSGLPPGAAHAEAVAIRLRRGGAELAWGEPLSLDAAELLALCERRGRSSVEIARADSSLLTELQLGSWFDADWRLRFLRRAAAPIPPAILAARARHDRIQIAADLAFWRGVREATTAAEWTRWTVNSYVALVYHRFAGDAKPEQERIDLAPSRFARQLRALRRLGFRHLSTDEIIAFHRSADGAPFPRRAFVVTVDDGFGDSYVPLREHAELGPQLFVPTQEIGRYAHWAAGERLMGWDEVARLARAGVAIGPHARHHRHLRDLDPAELVGELAGSRFDLGARVEAPLQIIAYPHGDHDASVCGAAAASGFEAGFTTEKGRNGAGTQPYCLRRVSVHAADGAPAILWKVLTGEALPRVWLRVRELALHALPP
jgi:peptidoglycan/xylan/chitin deacetylase (PgdA/CDA1 family)